MLHLTHHIIRSIKFSLLLLFFLPFNSNAVETSQLSLKRVHLIMEEMLSRHIKSKSIEPEMLKSSMTHYLEEADPGKIYLLESEVRPIRDMTQGQLQYITGEYREGKMEAFVKLNDLAKAAIARSRELEHLSIGEIKKALDEANSLVSTHQPADENALWDGYSKNVRQLKARRRAHFVNYAALLIERFGADEVMKKPNIAYERYLRYLHSQQAPYLDSHLDGSPRNSEEREHYLALHVLKALARSLDAHSTFFDIAEAEDMKTRLEKGYHGIGVVLGETLDGFMVEEIIAKSPAARHGQIRVKDRVTLVNGHELTELTIAEVGELIRGNVGEPVTLHLERKTGKESQTLTVQLTPETIEMKTDRVEITSTAFQDGIIGGISIDSFYEGDNGINTTQDVTDAIDKLRSQGKLYGLVMDLRNNGGGYLSQAVKLAGLFITNGVVVVSKYSDGIQHYYRDLDSAVYFDGPLVILTSRLTASAAEIVAQALQDYGVAIVVGDQQTYGKGTIQAQTVTNSDDIGLFKVTVGTFYTVSGLSTQLRGVQADILLPGTHNSSKIGEIYLEDALPSDAIPSAFHDTLPDIDPRVREWYISYYLPTLQQRQTRWKSMLPHLKDQSAARTSQVANYQPYINGSSTGMQAHKTNKAEKDKTFDVESYQLKESTNVVKDMVNLMQRSQKEEQILRIQLVQSLRDQ